MVVSRLVIEMDQILTDIKVSDDIITCCCGELEGVNTCTTCQSITPGTAKECISAIATINGVY